MAPAESMESAYHSAYHRAQRSWERETNVLDDTCDIWSSCCPQPYRASLGVTGACHSAPARRDVRPIQSGRETWLDDPAATDRLPRASRFSRPGAIGDA